MLETQSSVYENGSQPPHLAVKAPSLLPALLFLFYPRHGSVRLWLAVLSFWKVLSWIITQLFPPCPPDLDLNDPYLSFPWLLFHLNHSLSCYSFYPCLKLSCLFICDSHRFWLSLPNQRFKFPQGADICLFCSFLCLQSLLARNRCAVNICQVSDVDWVSLVGSKVTVNQFS